SPAPVAAPLGPPAVQPRAAAPPALTGESGRSPGRVPRRLVTADTAHAGQVQQPELADLHLGPPAQGRHVDPLPVDVRAVETPDIVHHEPAALTAELGVPPRNRHIVEENVAVGVPPGGGEVLVEQEAAAGVRPP